MKNRIHFLTGILIINCLGQTLYAELIQELNIFSIHLSNLAQKIKPVGSGRPLPPTPPPGTGKPVPPPPVKKPEKKPSEPKFTKFFRLEYGQDLKGSLKHVKIGLVPVKVGLVTDGDLVVYGPELMGATPEDFIVKHKIEVPGEIAPEEKTVDRLLFPVNKAKSIKWNSENKLITEEGPLKDFVLVKAADYKALTEQEKAAKVKENVLYNFYKTYLETQGTPISISNWWITEKIKPKESTATSEDLSEIADFLKNKLEEYKKLKIGEREKFLLTRTDYKDPKTGNYFNLTELLKHFLGLVSVDEYTSLSSWRIRTHLGDYKWPNLK